MRQRHPDTEQERDRDKEDNGKKRKMSKPTVQTDKLRGRKRVYVKAIKKETRQIKQ